MSYLTDEEKKMPLEMQLLQFVLGLQCCKNKGDAVNLLKDFRRQVAEEIFEEINILLKDMLDYTEETKEIEPDDIARRFKELKDKFLRWKR